MKKYIAFMATAALMLAACAKEEAQPTVGGETETITVELNAATKTQLSGTNTTWTKGDAVSVSNLGTLTYVEGTDGTFTGELNSASLAGTTEVTLNYPAGVKEVPTTQAAVANSFANGAALLEGKTTLADLRASAGATLSNKTALLEFSVAKAGDVTFEVGSTKYTVKGCKTGNTYYACVAPTTAKLTARIDGYLSKNTTNSKTFTASKIAKLGQLPAPEAFTWGIVGAHQSPTTWDIANPTPLYKVANNVYAVLGISLKSNGFKFAVKNDWDKSFGAWKDSGSGYFNYTTEMAKAAWYGPLYSNNSGNDQKNIGVSDFTKKYDIYLYVGSSGDWGIGVKYTIVEAGTAVTYPNSL